MIVESTSSELDVATEKDMQSVIDIKSTVLNV